MLSTAVLLACLAAPAQATEPPPAPPATAPAQLPTAAALRERLKAATRIEARSGPGEEPTWSKDLTEADRATLLAGLGDGKVEASIPRCVPAVVVTAYAGDEATAELGSFCDPKGPVRFTLDGVTVSLEPTDPAKVDAALASPVDR